MSPARHRVARVCLPVAVLAVLASAAAAQPSGRLVASGGCPTRSQMGAALAGLVALDGAPSRWTIRIASNAGGARMTLVDPSGQVALTRRLASRDCKAVASAFAVILHSFFSQLATRPRDSVSSTAEDADRESEPAQQVSPPPVETPRPQSRIDAPRADRVEVPGSAADRPAPSERAADRPAPSQRAADRPAPSQRAADRPAPGERAAARPAPRAPAADSAPAARTIAAGDDRRDGPALVARSAAAMASADGTGPAGGLELALAAGGTVSERTGAAAFGMVEAGWRFGRRLSGRIRLSGDTPTVQDDAAERVGLQPAALALGIGYEADAGGLWLRPCLLIGAAAWRVDALDLEAEPTHWSVQPLAVVGTAAGLRLGRGMSLRAEVGQTVYLRTDRYLVTGAGEVARSPRTALAIGVGIEWATFR